MDILKVVLYDPVTGKDYVINAQGELEVSLESIGADLDDLSGYHISDIDADATPNYYGFIRADGAYYILKEVVSAGADEYRYSKGTSGYTTAWTNRASETYNYYDVEF